MTNTQKYYLIGLVLVTGAAMYKATFISTMLFYMMVLIPLADVLSVAYTAFAIDMRHKTNLKRVNKGQDVEYEVVLRNDNALVFSPVSLSYAGSDILFKGTQLNKDKHMIFPTDYKKLTHALTCNYRGTYHIGLDALHVHGVLGLARWTLKGFDVHSITVLPKIHDFDHLSIKSQFFEASDSVVSLDKRNRNNFSSLRDYRPGDPLNRIHWKLSAKFDAWVSKEFEGNVHYKIRLLMNTSLMAYDLSRNIILQDELVESMVAMSRHFLENNIETEVHWCHGNHRIISGNHPDSFYNFLDTLAVMTFDEAAKTRLDLLVDEQLKDQDTSMIIYFTASLDHDLTQAMIRAKDAGLTLHVVLANLSENLTQGLLHAIDKDALILLLSQGITVYQPKFEDDKCRLEVM